MMIVLCTACPPVCVGLSTHQNQQNCVFVSAEPVVGAPTHRAISRPAYLHRARARFFQARDPWCKGLMFRCLFGAYYGDVNLTAAEYQEIQPAWLFGGLMIQNLGTHRSQTRKVFWTSVFNLAFPPQASQRHSIHREASLNPAPILARYLRLQWLWYCVLTWPNHVIPVPAELHGRLMVQVCLTVI